MSPNWKSSNDGHRCVLHQCQSVAVHFECLHGKMVCAVSKVYIKAQVESALIEVNDGFTGRGLIGELGDVAIRLIEALDDRDIELRPR